MNKEKRKRTDAKDGKSLTGKPKDKRDGITISNRSPVRIVQDLDNPILTRPALEEEIYTEDISK